MQAFIAIGQVAVSEHEMISVPVMGFFADADAAMRNAYAVIAHATMEAAPHLIDRQVTVTSMPMSDDMVREFLTNVNRHRPDMLKPPRGKAR